MTSRSVQRPTIRLWNVWREVPFGIRMLSGLLAVLLFAVPSRAQVTTGNLSGQVLDSSGAIISGAAVTATAVDTGYARSTKTGGDGSYILPDPSIGNYN